MYASIFQTELLFKTLSSGAYAYYLLYSNCWLTRGLSRARLQEEAALYCCCYYCFRTLKRSKCVSQICKCMRHQRVLYSTL